MTKPQPMVEMFGDLARRRSDHPALVGAARTVTYAELWNRSTRVANALAAVGVGEGERVAYLDLNNPEFFEVMIGAAKIGSAIAPINFRLTPPRWAGSSRTPRRRCWSSVRPSSRGAGHRGGGAAASPASFGSARTIEAWLAAASDVDPGREAPTTMWCCSSTPPARPGCPRA